MNDFLEELNSLDSPGLIMGFLRGCMRNGRIGVYSLDAVSYKSVIPNDLVSEENPWLFLVSFRDEPSVLLLGDLGYATVEEEDAEKIKSYLKENETDFVA